MNCDTQPKLSLLGSLANRFKMGLFETIYAKSHSNPETKCTTPRNERSASLDPSGGGDAPQFRKGGHHRMGGEGSKRTAGDRGKTGAGVTGSRSGRGPGAGAGAGAGADAGGAGGGVGLGGGAYGAGGAGGGQPAGARDPSDLPYGADNPGLLRYIHNAARYRLPQCFEGATVSVKQCSNSNWILGHSLSFSSVSPGGYKLLLSYIDKSKPTTLPYFVMEAAPGGQMSCEVRVGPTVGTRATVVAQIADAEIYSFESVFDAYFNTATASIIAVNREFIALHYLQAVTEQISLGAEVVARGSAAELSSASAAARWTNDENAVSATLGNRGLDLCYARALKPYLSVAAMLEVGFAIRRAVATLAYEWRADDWTVRGSADSDGLVGATLQRALGGKRAHLACAISALLNHPNDKFRLGFGITASIH